MSEYIHKSHNVTVLLYHLVFPAKYRRAVFDENVDGVVKEVCPEIAKRYEVTFPGAVHELRKEIMAVAR